MNLGRATQIYMLIILVFVIISVSITALDPTMSIEKIAANFLLNLGGGVGAALAFSLRSPTN